ncbi:MAG: hypothetical protein RI991_971, partial [Bacteroidota bacterium]
MKKIYVPMGIDFKTYVTTLNTTGNSKVNANELL